MRRRPTPRPAAAAAPQRRGEDAPGAIPATTPLPPDRGWQCQPPEKRRQKLTDDDGRRRRRVRRGVGSPPPGGNGLRVGRPCLRRRRRSSQSVADRLIMKRRGDVALPTAAERRCCWRAEAVGPKPRGAAAARPAECAGVVGREEGAGWAGDGTYHSVPVKESRCRFDKGNTTFNSYIYYV